MTHVTSAFHSFYRSQWECRNSLFLWHCCGLRPCQRRTSGYQQSYLEFCAKGKLELQARIRPVRLIGQLKENRSEEWLKRVLRHTKECAAFISKRCLLPPTFEEPPKPVALLFFVIHYWLCVFR
ncbi:hypothetical protein GOODEAATRI_027238 [Goodea atripinnis]|uniref:DUF6729 domain-containing protein n=1 Tax=Goodea atripinnis TaxID=208336 RepID=A0ABV0P1Q0_9TELE